jgi:hypothetical protein
MEASNIPEAQKSMHVQSNVKVILTVGALQHVLHDLKWSCCCSGESSLDTNFAAILRMPKSSVKIVFAEPHQ